MKNIEEWRQTLRCFKSHLNIKKHKPTSSLQYGLLVSTNQPRLRDGCMVHCIMKRHQCAGDNLGWTAAIFRQYQKHWHFVPHFYQQITSEFFSGYKLMWYSTLNLCYTSPTKFARVLKRKLNQLRVFSRLKLRYCVAKIVQSTKRITWNQHKLLHCALSGFQAP